MGYRVDTKSEGIVMIGGGTPEGDRMKLVDTTDKEWKPPVVDQSMRTALQQLQTALMKDNPHYLIEDEL